MRNMFTQIEGMYSLGDYLKAISKPLKLQAKS